MRPDTIETWLNSGVPNIYLFMLIKRVKEIVAKTKKF